MKEKLYIYIDESGDTGLKLNKGSSSFFIVALVIVKSGDLTDLSNTLRNIIGHKEIKFSKSNLKDKVRFFDKIKFLSFEGNIFVFNKVINKLNYEESITYSLQYTLQKNYIYSVFIDGLNKNSFSGQSINNIKKSFKNIDKIYLIDSKKNYLIQLADMLAGLINAIHKGKKDYISLFNIIRHKIKITHIK